MSPSDFNHLCVSSQKGIGTEFAFYLQLIESNRITPSLPILSNDDFNLDIKEEPAADVKVSIYKGKICQCNEILIVDDEDFNIDVLKMMTKTYGFKIVTAYNGLEAINIVKKKITEKYCPNCAIFKVILMDINMPIMSGWDSVRQIRNLEQ